MPVTAKPLRVAIIGTAARSDYLYGPLVQALPELVELVAVWGRSAASARRLGESLAVPWYTDLARLVREVTLDIAEFQLSLDRIIDELEERLDKPVVTSNQAGFWRLLRHGGLSPRPDAPGRLFAHELRERVA